jgi:biotin carboxyl carrier protein
MPARVVLEGDGGDWIAQVSGDTVTLAGEPPLVVHQDADGRLHLDAGSPVGHAIAALDGDTAWVSIDGEIFMFRVARGTRPGGRSQTRDHDALSPPMSATVVRVLVKPGDRVRQGDPLVALEAMKMELPIRAPRDGVVAAILCEEGQLVQPGQQLVELEPST